MSTFLPSSEALVPEGKLMNFAHGTVAIRAIAEGGEPWFLAADVCQALGVDASNISRRVPADEKGSYIIRTPGGEQVKRFVNEAGLYRLIFTSRRAEAEAFKTWVVRDVLPQIRTTGRYDIADDSSQTKNLAAAQRAMAVLRDQVAALEQENTTLDNKAVAAVGAEAYRGGQRLSDMNESLAGELGCAIPQVMGRLVELGVLERRSHARFSIAPGWKDLLFAETVHRQGDKEYVWQGGTPRFYPDAQRRFLDRLSRVIDNDIPVIPRDCIDFTSAS